MRIFPYALGAAALGFAAFWLLTRPAPSDPAVFAVLTGDVAAGEQVFYAGGCASCHAAPGAEGDAKLTLSGGQAFATDFGTFYAPNISTDMDNGIGAWTVADLGRALKTGTSPDGRHYYPAFPYTSYARMTDQDVVDLYAYMTTLPADPTPSRAHEVGFPFNIRRGLGLWKLLYLSDDPVLTNADTPELERGRYLVEALGHCAECHTPRGALGGLDTAAWMTGAPTADGKGKVPAITPGALGWSAGDIAYYLETGFTPDFDSAGGHMADVVTNMANLPPEDRDAIAAYLLALE